MKGVYTCEQCHLMDQKMADLFNYSGYQLMERAVKGIESVVSAQLDNKKILIVCGPGNNGGDGFALSRLLMNKYYDASVLNANPLMYKSSEHTQLFFRQAKHEGVNFVDSTVDFSQYDVIFDCLFGTGLDRELEEPYVGLVKRINESDAYVIAVDIPSGLNGDGLFKSSEVVRANKTVTIGCLKPCMINGSYRAYCGELCITNFYDAKVHPNMHEAVVVDHYDLKKFLPKRKIQSNKSTYGKGLFIGGSKRMPGAITLSLKSALRSGLGMTSAMIPEDIYSILALQLNEVMYIPKASDGLGFMDDNLALDELSTYDVICIGNGLGKGQGCQNFIKQVLLSDRPVVVDGDGIGLVAKELWLLERPVLTILTPHVKEMSDLCGESVEAIHDHPFEVLDAFHQKYPTTLVLLKDDVMMVADGSEHVIIDLGNNALAKGGSGDVLAGLVTSFFGQCNNAHQAAITASMVLGLAARKAVEKLGYYSVCSNDVINSIADVLKNYS